MNHPWSFRVNLGCGRNPIAGWHNVDRASLPGVDELVDLERPLPWADGTVAEFQGVDLIEHISDPLAFMAELYRVAEPGARCRFELPYGSSDDAWEDPTHVRPYFAGSWMYFAQPTYYRADYGYRGDWQTETIELHCRPGVTSEDILFTRNVVVRQVVTLQAVKPARIPGTDPMIPPSVKLFTVTS
jgi:hypothetical protein